MIYKHPVIQIRKTGDRHISVSLVDLYTGVTLVQEEYNIQCFFDNTVRVKALTNFMIGVEELVYQHCTKSTFISHVTRVGVMT